MCDMCAAARQPDGAYTVRLPSTDAGAADGSVTGHIADPDDTDYCLFCEVRLTDANRSGLCSAQIAPDCAICGARSHNEVTCPRRAADAGGASLTNAIRRVEESRRSHAEWAEHIPTCGHCQEHGPPQYIQSLTEHQQIVAEYDNVLACLRASTAQDEGAGEDPDPWRCVDCGSGRVEHIVGERDGSVTHPWQPHIPTAEGAGEVERLRAAVEALADEWDAEAKAASAAIEDDGSPFEIWTAQERAKTLRQVRTQLRAVVDRAKDGA